MTIYEISRENNPFRAGAAHLPATLVDVLRAQVQLRPDAEAVVELGGGRMTYRQLWDAAARVAGGLVADGVQPGDRVAVRHPAGLDWVLAFWGTIMAGGIVVAVNTRSAQPEVDFVLSDAGVARDLAPDCPLPDGEPYVAEGLSATDVAALFYTSGTTGKPKGVPTTHEAFVVNAENAVRCTGVEEGMRTLISVPLFHVTGCNTQLLVAAYVGGTAVIMPVLSVPELVGVIAAEQISFMVTVPAVYALMLRNPDFPGADVSSVRRVGYGGAPIAVTLVQALKAAFPAAQVFNGYGMTETASLMTVLPDSDAVDHADSVGYAVPSVQLGICADGGDPHVGELVARGTNVVTRYWNRPEADTATFVDGWLHTGDVVRVDGAGRIHIIDRMKDIIIRGGENISSIEVESALADAPGVLEAAVLAVPDEVMGEKVGAVLCGPAIDVDDVLEHCRARLADYKVPQYVSISAAPLPRNPGGKLLKGRLREIVQWGAPLR